MLIRKLLLLSLFFGVFDSVLLAQESKQKINILLLGKSGAGKSALINMFYNHLLGKSYVDDREYVIPFVHGTKDYEVNVDRYAELWGLKPGPAGESQTQGVYWYKIETKDLDITLWDTPGIPDTKGPKADEEHVRKIKNALATVDIHAFAIALPPDAFDRKSQEFLTTMNNIVNNLPKSYSENIIGIFTRVIGDHIDDDTKADFRTKLSTAFGGDDSKKLSGFYVDGSSFFNKTPRGPFNWAADGMVIAQIIDQVRKHKAAPREEVVELQSLMQYLEGNITALNFNVGNHTIVKQILNNATINLAHEERRRDANQHYKKQRQVTRVKYQWTHCGWKGCTVYDESEEFCKAPRETCTSNYREYGSSTTCRHTTYLETKECKLVAYQETENYEDEGQRGEHNAAVSEVTKHENTIKANEEEPEKLKTARKELLAFIVALQNRRNELAMTTDMSATIKDLEDKMKEISERTLSEEDKKKQLTPHLLLKKIYTQMANKVLNLEIDSDL
ncbi:MAG: GTPase domain-containing protein [Myxococcota bacterium]